LALLEWRTPLLTCGALRRHTPHLPRLRPSEAFYLATSGGARALGKAATIGTLDVGKEADLLVVDLPALLPYGKTGPGLDDLTTEDILALCIYRGGPHATLETYVRGKRVYAAPNSTISQ
jgi:cytosine/adenosine deaminase-related metal-dependent hydrolase